MKREMSQGFEFYNAIIPDTLKGLIVISIFSWKYNIEQQMLSKISYIIDHWYLNTLTYTYAFWCNGFNNYEEASRVD